MTDFRNPTAADLASFFTGLPPETPFRVADPDTGWTISKFTISVKEGIAWLSAEYSDMSSASTE